MIVVTEKEYRGVIYRIVKSRDGMYFQYIVTTNPVGRYKTSTLACLAAKNKIDDMMNDERTNGL